MATVKHKIVNRAATVQKPAASLKGVQRQAVATRNSVQIQTSMKVSSPKDPAEKEADATAKKIMRMAVPESSIDYVKTGSGGIFRQVKPEEKEKKNQAKFASPYINRFADSGIFTQPKKKEEEKIQRKAEGQPNVASNVAADIQNSMAAGSPLPLSVRRFMEPRFQANFSNVKIHTGDKSAKLNRQLNAQAFTTGNQIFFGKDKFKPDTSEGKELIAHELTHTIQQGAAIQRSEDVAVTQQSPPQVQRLGISDALDYFADKANLIPGFRMFTIVLGVNPINMSPVDRSAANIMRAIVEFIPGGGLITQALENHGVFEKVGNWVEQQIKSLSLVGSAIKQAISQFLDSLSWTDIFDLDGVWNRAKSIFTDPINRIISFAKGLLSGIIQFIKEAILRPLAKLAEGTEGYNLLKIVLGEDPVTGDPVAFDPDALIGGFMKLIGQEEVWNNLKKANGVARAVAWFNSAKAALLGFVRQIPALFISAFQALELVDIILVPRAFGKLASVFGSFIGQFISWAGNAVWNLLEIIFDVVSPGAFSYVKKTGAALKSILTNPLPFLGNLVKAAKLGFQNFADNIGGHLKKGLLEWLTGSLAGVYIPKALTLLEMGKFALSVLGITWAGIRSKIVKVLGPNGETIMAGLEKGFDIIVALVTGGPAAAWEAIKEQLTALKDMVVGGITDFVVDTIVKKAIPKIVGMFIPGAGFIPAIISIYDTVMVFVQKISKIIQVVTAFIDSIVAIAGGAIGAAAKRVENILSGLLSLAISFLAGFLGFGKVTDKIMAVIEKVRTKVDQAIDKAIAWIVAKAKTLFAKLFGKKDKDGVSSAVIKESFSMGPAGHTLTATLQGESIQLTMASNQDLALSLQLGSAISSIEDEKEVDDKGQPIKREPSQKSVILGHLRAVKYQIDNIRTEYVNAGKPEAFDKFIKPRLAASIGQLSKLAKYKPEIASLKPLISIGKPRYIPKGWNIRQKLYDATTGGGWTALSKSMRQNHSKILGSKLFNIWKLRDDKSHPGNYAKAEAEWNKMQANKEIPSPKYAPSFANYHHPKDFSQLKYETDHAVSLGTSWNSGEKNQDDTARNATTLNTSNLRVITWEENQDRSKNKSINPDFDRDVGPDFSSVVANSPKGSMIIDGKPFDDKP